MRIGKRRISKRLVLILVPVVLVLAGASGALAATGTFTDIAGNTHEASILKEAARGITTGYPDGTFRPDQLVTRGQMMTFLDRFNSGITCTECHNSGTDLTSKHDAWATSKHGDLAVNAFMTEGPNSGCAGCHSGGAFADRIAAGKDPSQVTVGDANPTPQDCRACHQIHTTYTSTDWALKTTAPVALYATPGQTYDGGAGNLCAQCHQDRRQIPAADATGKVATNSRFGPHHGPQADMLLGLAGAGATPATKSPHYLIVNDTCVTCHMGPVTDADPSPIEASERPDAGHTFLPDVNTCKTCHADATSFDVDGVQTAVKAQLDQLKQLLIGKGLLKADGSIVTGNFPTAQAEALWNYTTIAIEDKSFGVHNPAYTKALLTAGINALK